MTAPQPFPQYCAKPHQDLRTVTDSLRQQTRVATTPTGDYVLLRHEDVVAAALNDQEFSSQGSRFLHIPNGLDGEQHTLYRGLIDKYLTKTALQPFVPVFRHLACELMANLPKQHTLNAVSNIGAVFAVRAQCAWLGWPNSLEPTLLQWMRDNHAATRSQDPAKMAQVAAKFDDIIRSVLPTPDDLSAKAHTVTQKLCQEQVSGRPLTQAELVSILRNWTGGDLGSLALCMGVIVAYLVQNPHLQGQCRQMADTELEAVIDEILRLDDPFVSNRRRTRCPITLGEQQIPNDARVQLNWTSANRDEQVFTPDKFAPHEHAPHNLVYGIGKHVCPGRLLATWQLRIATQALLASVKHIRLAPDHALVREQSPLGGYSTVPVILE